jgi:Gamma-glutamyl cyclotransferase, AIG2-like
MNPATARTELLFSYGTLQLESVQISTFGRSLEGLADALPCFEQTMLRIEDPSVVETSGKTHHPIVKFTGQMSNEVPGIVFQITAEELSNADKYEVAAYRRICATLKSGKQGWVYRVTARKPGRLGPG